MKRERSKDVSLALILLTGLLTVVLFAFVAALHVYIVYYYRTLVGATYRYWYLIAIPVALGISLIVTVVVILALL